MKYIVLRFILVSFPAMDHDLNRYLNPVLKVLLAFGAGLAICALL